MVPLGHDAVNRSFSVGHLLGGPLFETLPVLPAAKHLAGVALQEVGTKATAKNQEPEELKERSHVQRVARSFQLSCS